ETFLLTLKEKRAEEAYLSTARAFRAETPRETFLAFAKDFPFAAYERAQWKPRSFTLLPFTATIQGRVTLAGETVPALLTFRSESGTWKIGKVAFNTAGAVSLPKEEETLELVRGTMAALAQALRKKDFSALHARGSSPWREEVTPEALENSSLELLNAKGLDLTALEKDDPRLSARPSLDSENALSARGYYPMGNKKALLFDLRYAYEGKAWKLAGIGVGMGKVK
ncbi:MAG: hypothetical protein AAB728_05275, partial [Patescibacteria group bacterium]